MPITQPIMTIEENGWQINLNRLHEAILEWGDENYREYPWRQTHDPYEVLVAEVMLQRTRADQVEPVYRSFLDRYPDPNKLAKASPEDLRDILHPLGLHSRADTLFEIAQEIKGHHDGNVPTSLKELEDLPGVGQYIAGAVCCFALGKAESLIDTNTVRISARLFGIEYSSSSRRTKKFRQLITDLLDESNPRKYNFAMLDLADSVCHKRTEPECEKCPLLSQCKYGSSRQN